MSTVPADGSATRVSRLMRVLLPAPLKPTMHVRVPGSKTHDTFSRAKRSLDGYLYEIPRSSIRI